MTTKPSMGKRRTVGGDEHNATTGWRYVMCYLLNHSGTAKVKRSIRRRERRQARQKLLKEERSD